MVCAVVESAFVFRLVSRLPDPRVPSTSELHRTFCTQPSSPPSTKEISLPEVKVLSVGRSKVMSVQLDGQSRIVTILGRSQVSRTAETILAVTARLEPSKTARQIRSRLAKRNLTRNWRPLRPRKNRPTGAEKTTGVSVAMISTTGKVATGPRWVDPQRWQSTILVRPNNFPPAPFELTVQLNGVRTKWALTAIILADLSSVAPMVPWRSRPAIPI